MSKAMDSQLLVWRFSHLGAQAADNVKESLALMTPCLPGVVYNRPTFPATFFRAICNVALRCLSLLFVEVKYGNGKLCKARLFSVSSNQPDLKENCETSLVW